LEDTAFGRVTTRVGRGDVLVPTKCAKEVALGKASVIPVILAFKFLGAQRT
jgi:hypothetical protein